MAIYLQASASLESLAAALAADLNTPGRSVFDPHYIVTQTEGMNNWLKARLAAHCGIAANCRFLQPADLISQLYYLLGGRSGELLSPTNMTWLLYGILGTDAFRDRFPAIAGYYAKSGSDKDVKRLALAGKMADLFDQYGIYRPAMMREWNRSGNSAEDWQHYLWTAARAASRNALPDKTVVGDFILNALRNEQDTGLLKARMPAVHLFGLSIITDYHMDILDALSGVIDVHFHILNPAPSVYWFDDRSERQVAAWRAKHLTYDDTVTIGNPLLTSWGKVVQDTFSMFFRREAFLNAYEELPSDAPHNAGLLGKIRHDIYNAATDDRNTITPADLTDGSVTINDCFTIAREVEVLYDYLVHLVDQRDARLAARDIVVMVSDVDAYAPYIRAVFSNAPYTFRYTIADESFAGGDNLYEALAAVLRMSEERFRAEEVLELLDLSPIRSRFAIGDPAGLRRLVDAANIRFGTEGSTADDTRFVSWTYGLKRIMFGICMSGGEAYSDGHDEFYPLDLLEGSQTADAVRFTHFAEVLMASIEERRRPRTVTGWVSYVEGVLRNLIYEPGDDADDQYNSLVRTLADYNSIEQWMPDEISWEVFARSFLQSLQGAGRSGLYAAGGITFCSLIPMRSIPFRVVAMLGMGYDKFPRRDRSASFDLMLRQPRRGDRSVKENDKHLFLETLLSAREYLYISYIGRSAKDNASLPPSVLIDELLDYIAAGMEDAEGADVRGRMIRQHPLHAFSGRYNSTDPQLYSYRLQVQSTGPGLLGETMGDVPEMVEVPLHALIAFLSNPVKSYYNNTLGIRYETDESLLSETELFALDGLGEWSLKNELLRRDESAREALRSAGVRNGSLPLRSMAEVALAGVEETVAPVRPLFKAFIGEQEPRAVTVEIALDGVLLKGTIRNVYGREALVLSWSKYELKYLIDAYVIHLAGIAAGVTDRSVLLSATAEKVFPAATLSPAEAKIRLLELVALYRQGHREMIPFNVQMGGHLLDAEIDELTEDTYLDCVKKSFVGEYAYPDAYSLREYTAGTFTADAAMERYRLHHRLTVSPLHILFPGYFSS